MHHRNIRLFSLAILPIACLSVIFIDPTTKGPNRLSAIPAEDLKLEREVGRNSKSVRLPVLVVHPGKSKPDHVPLLSTTAAPFSITKSGSEVTAPSTTPSMIIARNHFNEDGCLIAVETPIYQPILIHHGRGSRGDEGKTTTTLPTTSAPNIIKAAQRYIQQKFRGIKDHVQERMVMFYLPRAPMPQHPPTTPARTTPSTTTQPPTTAKPAARFSKLDCPEPNGLFPVDGDCHKFINCWKGRPHLQTCALGTLFSADLRSCEHAAKVNCQVGRSALTTPSPATTSTTTLVPTVAAHSELVRSIVACPRPIGLYPFDGDCKKFINCWKGRPHVQECANGMLFNRILGSCDDAAKVDCQIMRSGLPLSNSAAVVIPEPVDKDIKCPKAKGLFPFGEDCKKFINCWNNRPHVQSCSEGTLFNPITRECDHAAKVKCLTITTTSDDRSSPELYESFFDKSESGRSFTTRHIESGFKRAPLSPDSGQRIRLRGGAGPWEGYVEVRTGMDKPWGHVCDSADSWNIQEANVVCRNLGFIRGAQKSVQGLEFGPLTLDRVLIEKVECTGTETNMTGCKIHSGPNCPYLHEQVVGVRCYRDPQSLCGLDEYAHGNACYKLLKDELVTRETARALCEKEGGHLLQIFTQAENDFISDLLSTVAPLVTKVHTDGVGIKMFKKNMFIWHNTETPFNFTKWWPEWNRTTIGNPVLTKTSECVLLRNRFEYNNRCAALPYFFWTLGDCDVAAAVLCKKSPRDIGCVTGNGADYQGTANVSQTGTPCLMWSDPRIRHIQAKPSRAALIEKESRRSSFTVSSGSSLKHNYCRNPHGETKPWCFISPHEMEYCDIPICQTSARIAAVETTKKCKSNQYLCSSGECIPNTWICDGSPDCDSGSDEKSCIHYMDDFLKRENETLELHDVEKWMHTTLETCARRCAEAKSFTCLSFNHNANLSECILNSSNRGTSGGMVQNSGWAYFERKIYAVNCTSEYFECPNGKCLNQTSVCNGIDECGDRADELVCRSNLDFHIRLVGGNKSSEGRVEVKVFGQWGSVCDDQFSMNDANVICRQLGYSLGASQYLSQSAFGPGHPILMDDVQCKGNETSLADCMFAGWGVSNCGPEETAGVRCQEVTTTCSDTQFKCKSTGACIAIDFLCDTVDDCGDHSDENRTMCDSELIVRLAGGPDLSSGRVEVRHNGIWGTICDDEFGEEDASVLCNMMGFTGPAQVVKDGIFGPGQGPIWLDELGCSGTETSIKECPRLPWAKHNCRHSEDVGIKCSKSRPPGSTDDLIDNQIPDLIASGLLPPRCGLRSVEDNPLDPLGQPKIVKGMSTKPGAYPWQVGVRVKGAGRSDSTHWCGASIISEYFLITAAHCMEDFPKGLYVLRVGDYNTEDDDPEEEEFSIDRLYYHEEFGQGAHLNHDIALIRIKPNNNRGIRFGSYVQPICLPPLNTLYTPGLNCTISGWGSPGRAGEAYAIKLQSATVPLMEDEICKAPHVYGPERIKNGMLCAGFLEGGVDSCQGDSGGGLVCQIDGRPTLMGVTSWGFGCGRPNRPGVYTRLVQYLPWIYSKLAEKTS